MKTRTTIITVIFLLLAGSVIVKAQQPVEFAPVGAEWYYERLYHEGWNLTGITYDRFRSLEQVEINGYGCKKIEFYQHLDCAGVPLDHYEYRYITQEGNQVFEVEDGERLLLYDFGKEQGESWYAPKYGATVTVIGVDSITMDDGTFRKTLVLDYSLGSQQIPWVFDYHLIEGIGMGCSLFPYAQYQVGSPCVKSQIRCYSENGVPLMVSEVDCDYEVLAVDEQDQTSVVVMNTIVEDLLQIDFSEFLPGIKQIRIVDVLGNVLQLEKTAETSIDFNVSNLSSGLYFVTVTDQNRKRCVKKIVKK